MVRTLVKVVRDESKFKRQRYELVPEESKTLIIADAQRRTLWLCMKCEAFSRGEGLYVKVDPKCSAHGHVIPQEVTA